MKPEKPTQKPTPSPQPTVSNSASNSTYSKLIIQRKSTSQSIDKKNPPNPTPSIASTIQTHSDSGWTVIAPKLQDHTTLNSLGEGQINREAIAQSDEFEALAQAIYQQLHRRLAIEQERHFGGSTGRLPW